MDSENGLVHAYVKVILKQGTCSREPKWTAFGPSQRTGRRIRHSEVRLGKCLTWIVVHVPRGFDIQFFKKKLDATVSKRLLFVDP